MTKNIFAIVVFVAFFASCVVASNDNLITCHIALKAGVAYEAQQLVSSFLTEQDGLLINANAFQWTLGQRFAEAAGVVARYLTADAEYILSVGIPNAPAILDDVGQANILRDMAFATYSGAERHTDGTGIFNCTDMYTFRNRRIHTSTGVDPAGNAWLNLAMHEFTLFRDNINSPLKIKLVREEIQGSIGVASGQSMYYAQLIGFPNNVNNKRSISQSDAAQIIASIPKIKGLMDAKAKYTNSTTDADVAAALALALAQQSA